MKTAHLEIEVRTRHQWLALLGARLSWFAPLWLCNMLLSLLTVEWREARRRGKWQRIPTTARLVRGDAA
jgi:hypothetical protein